MLIGVTGTLASGKDSLSHYLVKRKGFFHFSLSDTIRKECDKRGLPKDRDTLVDLGNKLRVELGNDVLAKRAIEAVKELRAEKAVLTSIRNPDEVKFLREIPGFALITVDAPIDMRYQRIVSRKRDSDFVDFETFKAQEQKEMSGAPHEQDLKSVIEMADYHLVNDGTMAEFYEKIQGVLRKINGISLS